MRKTLPSRFQVAIRKFVLQLNSGTERVLLLGVIGILANSAVIASFIWMKSRLSPVSIVLLNLTLSDLGIILMGFPFNALSHLAGG